LYVTTQVHRRFDALVTQLEQMKVKVFLAWIPSHSDIAGNEIADSQAKQVAREIETGRTVVPESVKLNSTIVLSSLPDSHGKESGTKVLLALLHGNSFLKSAPKFVFQPPETSEYHIAGCC